MIFRFRLFFCMVLFFMTVVAPSAALASVTILVNGNQINFDVPPFVDQKSNRTLVPFRQIFEALGAEVSYDAETNIVSGKKGNLLIQLPVGSPKAIVNGDAKTLDVSSRIVNGRTVVPLRFISESMGCKVSTDGDPENLTIYITGQGDTVNTSPNKSSGEDTVETAKQQKTVVVVICSDGSSTVQGSGVIVDSNGLIVTNYHVIHGNNEGKVFLSDGKEYPVSGVVAFSKEYDYAVLKINASNLPTAAIGDSDDLELGQQVMAIGSPKGLQNTVSTGIVSGLRGEIKLIQISTPITHGSSGGGLFNYNGELVGITTAGLGEAELNFAIPINLVKGYIKHDTVKSLSQIASSVIKVKYATMCEGFDEENTSPIGPKYIFSPYSEAIYSYIELERPLEKDISYTGNWYYYNNRGKELVSTNNENIGLGNDIISFCLYYEENIPFETGMWQFELIIGDDCYVINFLVLE